MPTNPPAHDANRVVYNLVIRMKRKGKSNSDSKSLNHNFAVIRRQITPVLKRHGVSRAALFGSFARGEGRQKSDLDVLIEFKGNKSLMDLVALKLELEAKTHRKVDVLTYRSLHPAIRERIQSEQVRIL